MTSERLCWSEAARHNCCFVRNGNCPKIALIDGSNRRRLWRWRDVTPASVVDVVSDVILEARGVTCKLCYLLGLASLIPGIGIHFMPCALGSCRDPYPGNPGQQVIAAPHPCGSTLTPHIHPPWPCLSEKQPVGTVSWWTVPSVTLVPPSVKRAPDPELLLQISISLHVCLMPSKLSSSGRGIELVLVFQLWHWVISVCRFADIVLINILLLRLWYHVCHHHDHQSIVCYIIKNCFHYNNVRSYVTSFNTTFII